MYAKFNDTNYKILTNPQIDKSSKEMVFSSITIDFRDGTIDDLPMKWQEIQIIDLEENLIYTGYAGDININTFTTSDSVKKLEIELMSPMALGTVRTITISKTNNPLNEAITDILSPLIAEGFTIEVNTLSDRKVSFIYKFKTVESILNEMSNTYNFAWLIDENKKIYLMSVSSIKSDTPIINKISEFPVCPTLEPTISPIDYANIVNVKNQKILQYKVMLEGFVLPVGETINLPYPISISKNSGGKIATEKEINGTITPNIYLMSIVYNLSGNETIFTNDIVYNVADDEVIQDINIGFDGVDNGIYSTFLLVTDPDDKTLITGIKNGGTTELTFDTLTSYTTLVSTNTIYKNANEIVINKGKISTSGKIEKTVDFNNKYITKTDSLEYAKNILLRTSKQTDEIKICLKGTETNEYNTFIANALPLKKITLDSPEYFTVGDFIITDTNYSKNGSVISFTINARNTNLIENFEDLFRKDDDDTDEEALDNIYSILIDDDDIFEKKTTLVNGVVIDED